LKQNRRNHAALSRLAFGPFDRYPAPTPMPRILIALLLAACLGAAGARAQILGQPPAPPRSQPQAQPPTPPPLPPQTATAPYDRDLQRLSEILGALHFLRGICGSNEGQKWRSEAQALIDAEAPAGERHEQMVASFNRGYRAFQQGYRSCTPAADFAIRRYLQEGARIARDITARYAN
jgi:uncharacterized protein (TIGR02301 family)